MALLINKKVKNGGLSSEGCYIQLKPYLEYGLKCINVDRAIWESKAEYDEKPDSPTISRLDEIKDSYTAYPTNAPSSGSGKDVLFKMLYFIHQEVKDKILADNPEWTADDIEIDL